jgi:hypothetical protein
MGVTIVGSTTLEVDEERDALSSELGVCEVLRDARDTFLRRVNAKRLAGRSSGSFSFSFLKPKVMPAETEREMRDGARRDALLDVFSLDSL